MASLLLETIQDIATKHLRDWPILVWYDEGGTLADVVPKAVPKRYNFIQFMGSYLAIRTGIEKEDPEFKKKWFIYVPEKAQEPSWIQDYELFGSRVDLTLERILVENFSLTSNRKLKELLSGHRARALATNWEEIMKETKPPITQEQIERGLLAIAFNLGPNFSIGRAILEYVTHPSIYDKELTKLGLQEVFGENIQREMGLKLPTTPRVSPESLAAALLFSELVVNSKGLGAQELQKLLPDEDNLPKWANLTNEWLKHSDLREGFIRWSQQLEGKYAVKNKLSGLERLLNVMGFASVDEVLIQELCARLTEGMEAFSKHIKTIERVAEARRQNIWTEKMKVNVWDVIGTAAHLFSSCQTAIISLKEMTNGDFKEYLDHYVADEGWWTIDDLYRRLASYDEWVDERIRKLFIEPASMVYGEWLRGVGIKFAEATSKLSTWSVPGILKQQDFWKEIVGIEDEPVAILLEDALRYDLTRTLAQRLSEEGYKVQLRTLLASLPSITEVGMAALLPRGNRTLALEVYKGNVKVSLNGEAPLTERKDRREWLQTAFGTDLKTFELEDVLKAELKTLKSTLKDSKRIVVMDRDIDSAGTYLVDISVGLFEDLVSRVAETVSKLHKAGIKKVVVTTDHGFLLLPKGFQPDTLEGIKPQSDVVRGRRYAVGKVPKLGVNLTFPIESLGLSGDGSATFPRGLTCLSAPGEIGQFLHGGISLQEICITAVISIKEIPVEERKVDVKAEIPDTITTAIFLIPLQPSPTLHRYMPREVRVEVYTAEEKISESNVITLSNKVMKARLVLSKFPSSVDIRVIDHETKEVLSRKTVKVQLAGYDENI
jgi:hypothetical protein